MSHYRKALIEQMTLRNLSPKTMESYVQWMARLCQFVCKTPDRITPADVRRFLVYLITERGYAYSSVNQARNALKYYFKHIQKTPELVGDLPPMKKEFRLPEVLGQDEVFRLLHAPGMNVRNLTLLKLAYGCGLRVSELISLRITDIQGERGMVFVRGGKGRKDRYVPLSSGLLEELRFYHRACLAWNTNGEKTPWLFPSPRNPQKYIDDSVVQRVFNKARELAGVRRGHGLHTLRHCYATHSLEMGVDLKTLQLRMGHKDLKATLIYLHVVDIKASTIAGPYDTLVRRASAATENSEGQNRME
ncbi:MAG: tyrosine-type recombinase/integrase [Planctomycetota bacterium]|jgi:site-specific recombinase XerD|nr:tyrosine-type recombinase/integrase [Planctomycetota bacterium]MDP7251039.1 tyrosine-type recombinase/integrase [Planctomycetota bacterium]